MTSTHTSCKVTYSYSGRSQLAPFTSSVARLPTWLCVCVPPPPFPPRAPRLAGHAAAVSLRAQSHSEHTRPAAGASGAARVLLTRPWHRHQPGLPAARRLVTRGTLVLPAGAVTRCRHRPADSATRVTRPPTQHTTGAAAEFGSVVGCPSAGSGAASVEALSACCYISQCHHHARQAAQYQVAGE
jgi:hypothetical protein